MDRRTATRVQLAHGVSSLRFRFGQQSREAEPRDVTPFGLSLDHDSATGLSVGETVTGELRLRSQHIPVSLELRRRSRGRSGFKLATPHRAALARAYLRERFPRLVPRRETEPELLDELLRDSGYANLRAAECSVVEWQRFAADESFDYVYPTPEGRLLGHLSGTRVYDRTWLAHQLATLGGHAESGECRATLYECVSALPRLMDGEDGYLLAYFNLQKRWHALFFKDFVAWVNDAAASVLVEWDTFEGADLPAPNSSAMLRELRIGPVEPHELLAATALARSRLPSLMADALDLRPGRLSCAALNGDARRARHAIAVRSRDRLLGVALCETAPKQASLFNLLNGAQVFAGDAPFAARHALLHAVQAFYAERGVERPLLLCPPETLDPQREPSIRFRERMGAIAHGGAGLLQYENYCRLQMGRLFRRKERNHDRRTRAEDAAE
jgi:hypothetical protein